MRILLEANANTRARDIYGNTALWLATRLEHVAVSDLLKEATQREAVRTVRSRIHFRDDDNVTHPAPLDTDTPPKKRHKPNARQNTDEQGDCPATLEEEERVQELLDLDDAGGELEETVLVYPVATSDTSLAVEIVFDVLLKDLLMPGPAAGDHREWID